MSAGFDFLLKRGDGASPEVFTAVGALRTKNLNMPGDPIEVTTDDDKDANSVVWRTFETGPHGFEITATGVSKTTSKTDVQAMYDDYSKGTVTNYEVVVPFVGTWTVAMIVTSMTVPAAYDDAITFDIEMRANGAPTFVPET